MNIFIGIYMITVLFGVEVMPTIYAVLEDKRYEKWKKDNGYENVGNCRGLFRDCDLSGYKKVLSYLKLINPYFSWITALEISARRGTLQTLDVELENGNVIKQEEEKLVTDAVCVNEETEKTIPFNDIHALEEEEVRNIGDFTIPEVTDMSYDSNIYGYVSLLSSMRFVDKSMEIMNECLNNFESTVRTEKGTNDVKQLKR